MAVHEETVVLAVKDELSPGAQAAQGALARLENQIAREQGALTRLEAKLVQARGALQGVAAGNGGGVVNISQYRRAQEAVTTLGDRVGQQKDKISALRDRMLGVGHAADAAGHAAHKAHPPFRAIGQAAKELGGEAGQLTADLAHNAHILAKLGPAGAIAVVGFVTLLSVFTGFVEVVKHGIEAAGEFREQILELSSAGVTLYNSQRATIAGGEALVESIERVSQSTAYAQEKIKGLAVELRNAGQGRLFRGEQLESVLKTAAIVGAGGNDALAKSYVEVAKQVRFLGGDVDKLNDRMVKKFGAVAEAKMLNLGGQIKRLKENVHFLFTGADTEPFLRALRSVFSLFDRDTESAKSLRNIITKVTETGIGLFLRFTIVLLRAYIWLQNHEKVWKTIKQVVAGVVITFAAVAAAILAVVAANFALGVSVVMGIGAAINFLIEKIGVAIDWIKSIDFAAIGKSIVEGIANGIKNAGSAIFNALKGAVSSAISGVKNFIEGHSPSDLTARELGYPMGTGVAKGQEDAAPVVERSSKSMVRGGVEAAKSEVSSPAPASSGATINFTNCNFGSMFQEDVRKAITAIYEGEMLHAPEPS